MRHLLARHEKTIADVDRQVSGAKFLSPASLRLRFARGRKLHEAFIVVNGTSNS